MHAQKHCDSYTYCSLRCTQHVHSYQQTFVIALNMPDEPGSLAGYSSLDEALAVRHSM